MLQIYGDVRRIRKDTKEEDPEVRELLCFWQFSFTLSTILNVIKVDRKPQTEPLRRVAIPTMIRGVIAQYETLSAATSQSNRNLWGLTAG